VGEVKFPTIDELIDVTMQPTDVDGVYECTCGATGEWWDGHPTAWGELLCDDCVSDLFDTLNPSLRADDVAYLSWTRTVERMIG
jgi:hypothetical protein